MRMESWDPGIEPKVRSPSLVNSEASRRRNNRISSSNRVSHGNCIKAAPQHGGKAAGVGIYRSTCAYWAGFGRRGWKQYVDFHHWVLCWLNKSIKITYPTPLFCRRAPPCAQHHAPPCLSFFLTLTSWLLRRKITSQNMLLTGCGCSLGKDGQCFCRQFTDDYIMAVQGKSCERAHTELDMFLMGELRAVLNTTADTMHAIWRATKNE